MTADEALQFLKRHQPMPPTGELDDTLIQRFDQVRTFFSTNRDERCVPLLLNSFGEGDGHGVYQLVEDTILGYAEEVVVPALRNALLNPMGSIRYWNAQIAAHYPSRELIGPLVNLLRTGDADQRLASVAALEGILVPEVRLELQAALEKDIEPEVKDLIREVVGK